MAKETAEQKLLKMMQQKSAAGASAKPASAPKKEGFSFTMRNLNQILVLGIIVCAAGLVLEIRSGLSLLNQETNFVDDVKSPRTLAEIALPSAKDAKYYLDKVNARNIFKPYEVEAKTAGEEGLAKRLSRYKLVGIAWLDLPETASIMIEDTKDKTTHFLKQGEQLEGVSVKTIYTDRAVFRYENEETTIKL